MIEFTIDPAFITSVNITTDHSKVMSEEEQILMKLKGHTYMSFRSEDHPEFTKLREQLGKEKYIQIERGWWNGDRVIKPFILNGSKFKKGDKFVCAGAMTYHLKSKYKK